MTHTQLMLRSLDELEQFDLTPTDKAAVQLVLIVQNFLRSDWKNMSEIPFEDWTVRDICNALTVKVAA